MAGTTSYGFPEDFTVSAYTSSGWQNIRTVTGFPRPYREQYIIIPLETPLTVSSVKIEATKLRTDDGGTYYYFQLGEVLAGYDNAYSKLRYRGNNGIANEVEFQKTGADAFDPSKMVVWNYDRRNPIVTAPATSCGGLPSWRNIYGANAVYLGGTTWRLFFGGYNGLCTTTPVDETWTVSTADTFTDLGVMTYPYQAKVISQGDSGNVGNPNAIRLSSGNWKMVYTTYHTSSDNCLNINYRSKPGYSTSTDGVNWTPAAASTSYMASVTSYPGSPNGCSWGNAYTGVDVNGTNVLLDDGGYTYFYWKGNDGKVQIARNNNGTSVFAHEGLLVNGNGTLGGDGAPYTENQYGVNDVKKINGKYLWAYHYNTAKIWYSWGTSAMPSAIADPTKLFDTNSTQPVWGTDPYIVSAGWVTDGTKLKGILYGASTTSALNTNAIFARWLQKKVKMTLPSGGALEWMKANGPDNTVMLMVANYPLETGTVTIYDTDGSTVLHTSPPLTLRQGDKWEYVP